MAAAAMPVAVEKPSSKGQAWFCTTGLPSDIVIEVGDMSFHLHKFPLMSKSRKLHNLITEQEAEPSSSVIQNIRTTGSETQEQIEEEERGRQQEEDEIEEYQCQIVLSDFPGGSEAFEMAAKFCYGVKIDLTASNVAPLRCAGEFLEMTEEYSEENLISKTERFLSQYALQSLNESIKALTSCERVMPLAESLGITQRCIDSISSRVSSADPTLFGWPVRRGGNGTRDFSKQILWNGLETGGTKKSAARNTNATWLEHLTHLSFPLFKRVIFAFRDQDLSSDIIESCLIYYAKKYIPGISLSNRKSSSSSSSTFSEIQQRELLETIIGNLPLDRSSRSSSPIRILFGLFRTANILNASEACRAALEKKIGSQLEQATLDDLLIPSYSYLNETLYDIDCVERILANFLEGLEQSNASGDDAENNEDATGSPALMIVGKLFDAYLSEIASDANLKPEKFYDLAMSLPEQARLFDDGLYRAVDLYLKAHPWITESDREKICGVINCQKLTLEACTHAAQNERLPLRAVVQVLFFEQLQLRHAIAGTILAAETPTLPESARPSVLSPTEQGGDEREVADVTAQTAGKSNTWRVAVRENQVLRLDMDSMRTRVHQLERECSTMKKVIQKIDKTKAVPQEENGASWRGSLTKRFGCKFKTQVCDSHEQTVVNVRKGRHHHHQQ